MTWDEQVQKAIDCYEAGARILHIHVRDPKTGKISKNFAEYADQIVLLHKGRTLRVGGPSVVYQRELLEQVFQTPLSVESSPSGRPRVTILPIT